MRKNSLVVCLAAFVVAPQAFAVAEAATALKLEDGNRIDIRGAITTVNNIDDIKTKLAKNDNKTLVVWDCDDVLLESCDSIVRSHNWLLFAGMLRKHIDSMLNRSGVSAENRATRKKEIFDYYYSIMLRGLKWQLLNAEWPQVIADLQAKDIKTMLLTSYNKGKYGVIDSIVDWKYNSLVEFGIDFKKSWSDIENIDCGDVPLEEYSTDGTNSTNPSFEKGILLNGKATKGYALKAFLSKIPNKFNKVIFIDDRLMNVESMGKSVTEMEMEFVGINYTYGKEKDAAIQVDLAKAQKQVDILVNEERWVSIEDIQ